MNVIAIAKFVDKQLHVLDVFGKSETKLEDIINSLANSRIDEILLGFTPLDCRFYKVKEVVGDDVLFIKKSKTNLFDKNKVMFPLLSHA